MSDLEQLLAGHVDELKKAFESRIQDEVAKARADADDLVSRLKESYDELFSKYEALKAAVGAATATAVPTNPQAAQAQAAAQALGMGNTLVATPVPAPDVNKTTEATPAPALSVAPTPEQSNKPLM